MGRYLKILLALCFFIGSLTHADNDVHRLSHHGVTIEYKDLSQFPSKILLKTDSFTGFPVNFLATNNVIPFKVTIKNESDTKISIESKNYLK